MKIAQIVLFDMREDTSEPLQEVRVAIHDDGSRVFVDGERLHDVESQRLYAGKYRTVEDLERGYKELSRLHFGG